MLISISCNRVMRVFLLLVSRPSTNHTHLTCASHAHARPQYFLYSIAVLRTDHHQTLSEGEPHPHVTSDLLLLMFIDFNF